MQRLIYITLLLWCVDGYSQAQVAGVDGDYEYQVAENAKYEREINDAFSTLLQTFNDMQRQIQRQEERKMILTSLKRMIEITSVKKEKVREAKEFFKKSLENIKPSDSRDEIKKLENLYNDKLKIIQSSYYKALENHYAYNKFKAIRLLPATKNYLCKIYYGEQEKGIRLLKQTDLSFGNKNTSFENEVVAGYLSFMRLGISSTLAVEETETFSNEDLEDLTSDQINDLIDKIDSTNLSNSTLSKIISGGGEVNIKGKTPLFNLFGNYDNKFKLISDLTFQYSMNVPAVGNTIPQEELYLFNSFGIENKAILPIINFTGDTSEDVVEGKEAFAFFGKFNLKNAGGNKAFRENLNIDDERFWYYEWSFGLIYKNFVIHYTDQIFKSDQLDGSNTGRLSATVTKLF